MQKVSEIIVVEGRYDKNKLAQIVDAVIIETNGFGIFRDADKIALIRKLSENRGVIVLTDSDSAGFMIRGRLRSALPDRRVLHAYIPDIYGKERRKSAPSKEGKLGVEGMDDKVILDALRRAGANFEDSIPGENPPARTVTKADFYADGLTGRPGSTEKRKALLGLLELPERLTANGLLEVINAIYSYDEYREFISQLDYD